MGEVKSLVAVQLGVAEVRAEDRLMEDLGAESADVVNVVAALEDRFGITIEEEEIAQLRSVADLARRVTARRVTAGRQGGEAGS